MSSVNQGYGFGSFLGTFVVGAAAGAAIALLTAPRSGRETRARLKDAARDIPGAVRQAGARAVKAGQAAFTQAKEEAVQAYSKATEERQGAKDYKGYAVDKELPRFAK